MPAMITLSTPVRVLALTALMALSPALLAADKAPPAAEPAAQAGGGNAEVRIQYPENMCFGGLEHSKRIVDESQVSNPFKETTRLGCEVDGGSPQTMPDLPTPTADQRIMA
ncbi:MAG: hypothetical protein R3E86_03035 [Pseudomonadales bacterium]